MAETVDELTVDYEEDGILKVKELDKYVLTKGAWATVMYLYQDYDRAKEDYGQKKVAIRRYQKRDGEYAYRSKFKLPRSRLDELDEIEVGLDALVVGDRAVARHEGRLAITQELVAGVGEPGGDRIDIVREEAEEDEVATPQDGRVVDSKGDVAGRVAGAREQRDRASAEIDLCVRVL